MKLYTVVYYIDGELTISNFLNVDNAIEFYNNVGGNIFYTKLKDVGNNSFELTKDAFPIHLAPQPMVSSP